MSGTPLDVDAVVGALGRAHAVAILRALDVPRSVQDIAAVADVPEQSVYNALAELTDAGLVGELDGYRATEYYRLVSEVRLEFAEDDRRATATARERPSVRLGEVAD